MVQKKFTLLLFCMSIGISSTVQAAKKEEKIYVDFSSLQTNLSGFWFQLPESALIIGAESLHVDNGGYYLKANGVRWICPYCRSVNKDISNPVCKNPDCNKSRI